MVKLTVGIPFHNACDCLNRCISAVTANLQEVGADYQLLLLNDGSSPEELSKIDLPTVDIVQLAGKPNPNLGFAVNYALDHVRPDDDYYWNVESDVYPEPGCLAALLRRLQEMPDISAARGLRTCNGTLDPKRGYHRWWHMTCMLVRGEHARNPAIRVEADRFNLWYVDQDYGCCLSHVTGQQSYFEQEALFQHDGGQSVGQMLNGEWPGSMSISDALTACRAKWR